MKKTTKMREKNKLSKNFESFRNLGETQKKKSTIREFILLTLIHAEDKQRKNINREFIIERIKGLYNCISIVVATEEHQENKGKHYHVGIWATDASKNTLRSTLRKQFREWEGRAIDITLHKGWGSICAYILKEDKEPLVWGEYNLEQIKGIAIAHEQKKEVSVKISNLAILRKLEQVEDWYQIYKDDILANKVLTSLPRMKEAFEDLKVLKDIETNVFNRIIDYLEEKGNPKEYDVEEIREKYLVIDWIACQLCFRRPLKTKQLFIYGEPSTQKTLLLHYLAKVLKIYFASSRTNDFAGANDYYDLWTFDEFHERELWQEGQQMGGSTVEGSSFVNNLLKVLDGQECRLDSKYSKVFKKKRNVPIIMIANKLPQIMERHGPFRARFFRIRFSRLIQNLEEERVIATLWGCLVRRAMKSPYARERETPKEVDLAYNNASTLIILAETETEQWEQAIKKIDNPIKERRDKEQIEIILNSEPMLITKAGEFYTIKPKIIRIHEGYQIIIFEILKLEEEQWEQKRNQINLIHFANIPIKKKQEEQHKQKKQEATLNQLFQQQEEDIKQQEQEQQKQNKNTKENIIRLSSIFLDKKEREWIKREQASRDSNIFYEDRGQVNNEQVWSTISVQRHKTKQKQDYAMWPLEIKIFHNKTIKKTVFPAVIRNIRKGAEEEKTIREKYKHLKKYIQKNKGIQGMQTIKSEISLARNAEGQKWNLEC